MLRSLGILGRWGLILSVMATPAAAADDKELVQHGRYLVHQVAMCVQCHTPRTQQGQLDRTRLLQGAPMPVESPFSHETWAFNAPSLAGLPGGWTAEDMIRLLQTGKGPGGKRPRPPMPPFRMTREDAAAVAAYLQSLR
jgi:mono/diheme cytochrome c family protein